MTLDTLPEPPDSPIADVQAAADRLASHQRARDVALDELVLALAEAGLDDLERQVSNFRERQRPVAHWLELLVKRLREVAP